MNSITEKIQTAKEQGLYIDYYCERIAGNDLFGFSEFLNTLSNIAFLVAAIFVFKEIFKRNLFKAKYFDIIFLGITLAAIGVGSSIYHYSPSNRNELLDVIPITIFIHFYLVSFFVRVLDFKIWQALIVLAGFFVVGYLAGAKLDTQMLNGTIMYIPTYLMMLVMIGLMVIKKKENYKHLLITSILWTFSLTFRTIDLNACEITNGIGTHLFWHVLNAVVLYRLTTLLIIKSRNN